MPVMITPLTLEQLRRRMHAQIHKRMQLQAELDRYIKYDEKGGERSESERYQAWHTAWARDQLGGIDRAQRDATMYATAYQVESDWDQRQWHRRAVDDSATDNTETHRSPMPRQRGRERRPQL